MSKTKEIEGYIHEDDLYEFEKGEAGGYSRITLFREKGAHKAEKFLKAAARIEIPEKKIEVTETQIDEAFKYADAYYDGHDIDGWNKCFKAKLFGQEK